MIIVIAMLATTLFSFVFFLPQAQTAHAMTKESDHVQSSVRTQSLLGMIPPQEQRFLTEQLNELERFIKAIQENFKFEVDFRTLMQGAFDGALDSLGDPYSVFFGDDDGDAFVESLIGEFGGIGVTLRANNYGATEVTGVFSGAPAERAGIIIGDVIIRVDGRDVASGSVTEISQMLRGEVGTSVIVTVRRSGETRNFTITRELIRNINLEYEMLENNIGYIRISMFDSHITGEFEDAVESLKSDGAQSLILDIRHNIGGLIEPAIEIADKLIPSGNIVHLARRGEIIETVRATTRGTIDMETVVLINEYSASASEILAGALRDHDAATLVGTTTYGKGSVQTLANANDGRAYTLSIYYFLTPNRLNIHQVGIAPHHVVRNSLGEDRVAARTLYNVFAPFAEEVRSWPGDMGINVIAAQQRLLLLGFSVDLTGIMDEKTVAAISAFQGEQGLWPGGILDFTTMARIQEVTSAHVNNESLEDLQLKRAIELLSN
jgi:carboxyl-terminal processing protease